MLLWFQIPPFHPLKSLNICEKETIAENASLKLQRLWRKSIIHGSLEKYSLWATSTPSGHKKPMRLRSQLKSNVRIKGGSFIVVSDHNATVPTMRLIVSGLILQFVRMGRYHGVFPEKGMKALNFPSEGTETSD